MNAIVFAVGVVDAEAGKCILRVYSERERERPVSQFAKERVEGCDL